MKKSILLSAIIIAALGIFVQGAIAEKMKTHRHSDFSVNLPRDWKELESDDETVVLGSKNGKDRLTISIMRLKPGLSSKETRAYFEKILNIRLAAEKQVVDKDVMLTKPHIVAKETYIYAKYGGYEKSRDRRFIALLTSEKNKLLTFYVESLKTSDNHINTLAAAIFGTIVVK